MLSESEFKFFLNMDSRWAADLLSKVMKGPKGRETKIKVFTFLAEEFSVFQDYVPKLMLAIKSVLQWNFYLFSFFNFHLLQKINNLYSLIKDYVVLMFMFMSFCMFVFLLFFFNVLRLYYNKNLFQQHEKRKRR